LNYYHHGFAYPAGWGYQEWGIGVVLPGIFLAPTYFFTDYVAIGLAPPAVGFQWIQYGPDLLLVNMSTGVVTDTAYGAVDTGDDDN